MGSKTLFSSVLVLAVLGLNSVQAQTSSIPEPPPIKPPVTNGQGTEYMPGAGGGLSDWILYPRDYRSVGPTNGRYMGTELFLRCGPSIPFGTETLGPALDVGWMIQGGGRALFYNDDQSAAWILEPSISYHNNQSHRTDLKQTLSILVPTPLGGGAARVNFGTDAGVPGVTIREYHRTFVNWGGGRLWYLIGTADDDGMKWRFGLDAGGRWGSSSMEFNEIRHRTDVIGAVYTALQSDLEIPFGGCVLQGGFRSEWGYTWSDILQGVSDVQDVNLLINLGVRY